ncbi:MAG: VOC family protein [Promethearchaeota archaeon]|jgi:catechol 2,3-dioxygenase-like lactoylglutathione lyase family enzyme
MEKKSAPMIKRIIHFNVVCSNLEKSLEFYVDLLGGHLLGNREKEAIIKRKTESGGVGIALGLGDTAEYKGWVIRYGYDKNATLLDLLQWTNPPSTGKPYDRINNVGITRISLEVDDVDKVYNYLKSKGVEFISPPQVADLTPERPGRDLIKIATALDPDGIFVQLEQFMYNQD